MTVHVYKSTDAGAPAQLGGTGTVIGILDACLVNGYGSKAAAGWTKVFSGTDTAVYKGVGANAKYLRVGGGDLTSGVFRATLLFGYETMTDVNTGTGRFPNEAETGSNATYCVGRVESNTNATPLNVPWLLVATDKFFWFCNVWTQNTNYLQGTSLMGFGEFPSFDPNDTNNTVLIGNKGAGAPATAYTVNSSTVAAGGYNVTLANDIYGLRSGKDACIWTGLSSQSLLGTPISTTTPAAQYPSAMDGKIHMATAAVYEEGVGIRGRLPGLFSMSISRSLCPYKSLDVLTGLAGKELTVMAGASSASFIAFETSDTW